jgi:hypothetical protein
VNRSDFQQLADVRIAEAAALLRRRPPMPDGAYYLAGYAGECALKACIAKLTGQHDFPDKQRANDSHTHNIELLIRVAGLDAVHKIDAEADDRLHRNWVIVKDWSERSRYGHHSLEKAKRLYAAITDPTNGVLPWIKAHW